MSLQLFFQTADIEAGCDEAGRGCLAGPVFAAAVVLPPHFNNALLNDSKLLSEKNRLKLRDIIEKEALAWAVASVSEADIDRLNIANAAYVAMGEAVRQLNVVPDRLIIDGKFFKPFGLTQPYHCVIKGDSKIASIAAASILAKTYRDDYMQTLDTEFPEYKWAINKGYPTAQHRAAIAQFGATPHHRQSFTLLPKTLSLF